MIIGTAILIVVAVGIGAGIEAHKRDDRCRAIGGEPYRALCLIPDGKVWKL